MNQKIFLLLSILSLLGSLSNAQIQNDMIAKQITVGNEKVYIHYFQQGQGDTTFLFLHGWCIDGTYWKNQVEYFSEEYSVYAIDLPGFGKSKAERTNWSIEAYADDIAAFIDTLNLKNVILIAHSMSGEIMLQLALTNSPKIIGIVGIDNFKVIDVAFTPEQLKQMSDFFPMLENDFKNSAPLYADMMLFHQVTPEEVKLRVKTDFANANPVIGYGTFMNQMQYAASDTERLEQLKYKLYLINTDGFPTNESGLNSRCKNGFQIEYISSSGHYPMLEKPAEFNALLEKVLDVMM